MLLSLLEAKRDEIDSIGQRFSKRMRMIREASGNVSQQQVALLMNVTFGFTSWHQTTVAKVEAGERGVKLDEAVAIAAILDVPLSRLID